MRCYAFLRAPLDAARDIFLLDSERLMAEHGCTAWGCRLFSVSVAIASSSCLEKRVFFAQVFANIRLSEGNNTGRVQFPRLCG